MGRSEGVAATAAGRGHEGSGHAVLKKRTSPVLHDRWLEKNSALHIISVYSSLNRTSIKLAF
jgi:hypothetical protein